MSQVSDPQTVAGPLKRYRVMAIVTGVFLLVLTANMLLKYVVNVEGDGFLSFSTAVAIIHGWIYVIYLVTCYFLWSAVRWPVSRLVTLALGGIVPLLSFILERRIVREVNASLEP